MRKEELGIRNEELGIRKVLHPSWSPNGAAAFRRVRERPVIKE